MNLRGIANSLTTRVNPNIPIVIKVANSYTIDPLTLEQVPSYLNYNAMGQLQALDGDDLDQINNLNIAGVIRALYVYGSISSVIRPDGSSSTHVSFESNENGVLATREWNVFKVLETWPGWCKVAIVMQVDNVN